MCGIAGIIGSAESTESRAERVARMNAAMHHRGPDDTGIHSTETACIGMRRLAIFDPAHGHQPMATKDGRHVLVSNGAIYNFQDLRAELEPRGHSFHTHCNTEVLLAALVEWGAAALPKLRGMFAFAWWDSLEKRLFMARDPYGIKPLYYHTRSDRSLIFASELNALLTSGLVSTEIDARAANSYLDYLAVPAPATIYRKVHSLRPGECAVWQGGKFDVSFHWTPAQNYSAPDLAPVRSRDELT